MSNENIVEYSQEKGGQNALVYLPLSDGVGVLKEKASEFDVEGTYKVCQSSQERVIKFIKEV